jgi:hypothetical protein
VDAEIRRHSPAATRRVGSKSCGSLDGDRARFAGTFAKRVHEFAGYRARPSTHATQHATPTGKMSRPEVEIMRTGEHVLHLVPSRLPQRHADHDGSRAASRARDRPIARPKRIPKRSVIRLGSPAALVHRSGGVVQHASGHGLGVALADGHCHSTVVLHVRQPLARARERGLYPGVPARSLLPASCWSCRSCTPGRKSLP